MRQDPEFFGDDELELIYMARRLNDALDLETVLNDAGVDYLVETGTFTGGFLMKRDLTGAFFYVSPGDAEASRTILGQTKRRPYQPELE